MIERENSLTLLPRDGKQNRLRIEGNSTFVKVVEMRIQTLLHYTKKYDSLKLYKSNGIHDWSIWEAISQDDDLFFDFCMEVANKVNIELQ